MIAKADHGFIAAAVWARWLPARGGVGGPGSRGLLRVRGDALAPWALSARGEDGRHGGAGRGRRPLLIRRNAVARGPLGVMAT